MAVPETRASLMIRVRDPADHEAWHDFSAIYRPVILRLAKSKGMQDADAEDIAQYVLSSVSKAIQQREHDPQRSKFRTWLHRITQNAIINAVTRGKPDRGTGDTAIMTLLNDCQAKEGLESDLVRLEHQREVFRWAARQVRQEFQPATWDAFWKTAIENRDCESVAKELGKKPGSIYAARSRIMRRIQDKVAEYESEEIT